MSSLLSSALTAGASDATGLNTSGADARIAEADVLPASEIAAVSAGTKFNGGKKSAKKGGKKSAKKGGKKSAKKGGKKQTRGRK
jgi:hypothetical protein